jgi:hypothetical protein
MERHFSFTCRPLKSKREIKLTAVTRRYPQKRLKNN